MSGSNSGSSWIRKDKREAFFERDNWVCVYCGKPAYGLDHMVSRHDGGSNGYPNIVAACKPCNDSKGCKSMPSYLRWLHPDNPTRAASEIRRVRKQSKLRIVRILARVKRDVAFNARLELMIAEGLIVRVRPIEDDDIPF